VAAARQNDVVGTIRGHFEQFSQSFTCVNHLQAKVASISEHLTELSASVRVEQIVAKPLEAAALHDGLMHRLREHESILSSLSALAEVLHLILNVALCVFLVKRLLAAAHAVCWL
jgi:hypothetical protein